MLDALFGSKSAKKVLLYLQTYGEGYGRGIAETFAIGPIQVQNQLKKFEEEALLVSRLAGRTRLYTWNPRNPLVKPLRRFLESVIDALPESEIQAYYRRRRRPRKPGQPL